MYAALTQEPWCFHPDQIARLTDWQVEHLYFRPARERAEEFRRASGRGGPPDPAPVDRRPTREEYARNAEAVFGKSRDWGAEYDRLTGAANGTAR